jgi:glycosyltransferase involved in cell wall biosynthesis
MSSQLKVLWITPRWPLPAQDGARIATLQLLKPLAANFEITLVGVLPDAEEAVSLRELGVRECRVVRRHLLKTHPIFRLLGRPMMPVTFSSFTVERVRAELTTILSQGSWDWIVFDGMHGAIPFLRGQGLPQFSFLPSKARLVYRAHNVEFSIWERAARMARFPRSLVFNFQARLVRAFEASLCRQCDWILPVSEQDSAIFTKVAPQVRQEVIRIGQHFPSAAPARTVNGELTLGFLGKLDWMPNRQGLSWFLDKVWPHVSGLRLRIAGSGHARWLGRYKDLPGIEWLGRVNSIDAFYSGIDASIVPLFIGSGTRVKVIEASRFAVPCISTALGVEGCPLVPGSSYVQAESVDDWVSALKTLSRAAARGIGASAFLQMKDLYDGQVIAQSAAAVFRTIVKTEKE